jgi:Lrp/AsnC family transcriptional regulator, leucine-responsive regulatory protein
MELDNIDLKILDLLKENGRMSHEAIAGQVNLSRPAVRSRILSLEQQKIITGYATEIDYSKLGYPIQVLIYLKLNDTNYKKIMAQLEKVYLEDIMRYSHYRMSGEWCILLKVMSRSQAGLTKYLDLLQEIDGIVATNTVFLFNS